ncbi:zinc finger FYVE domain-containing protein 26-like [Watersipora subatra]|uniref:zinc finger FYVE domain-containing protein 26-like n=1 Tax=Watersipora subatra TaxID=2589382 RepID=UPI00355B7070
MKLILDKLEHKRGNPQVTKSEEGTEGTAPSLSSMESSQEASVLIVPAHNRLGFSLDPQTTTLEDGEETEVPEEDTGCSLSISDSILQDAKFKISDVAVQYLREQSPVVAMLLDIIYDDMCFNGDGGKHFSSEILRKEYPHLQRYLMQFIAPLCVHIYEEVNDIDQLARIELPEYIKSAILTHKSCLHLEHAASRCLDALIKDDKYHEVVDVIHRLTALTGDSCSDWLAIRDYALIKNASEQVSTEALNCIKCLRCERLQANIVILSLHKSLLTAEKCLQLLPLCEKRLLDKGDNSLVLYLNNLHTKMSAYHRIMLHAQAKREMTIEGCPAKIISALASAWQSVGVMLSEHPREVAHLLFDAEEFQFAKKLIDIQEKEDKDLRLLVYKRYIVNFLDSNPANIDEITSVLRGSVEDDVHWCFSLCMQVLQALKNPSSMLVIISFMSRNMADSLGDKQKENLDLGHLGVQMLLELDQAVHPQYRQLMFQPLLIFEQLLMNAKISWAARVAPLLLKTRGKTHFTEEINTLLVTYAEKAINFPLLRVTEDKDGAATSISPNVKAVRKLEVVGSPSKASLAQRALLGSSLRKSSSQQSLAPRLSRTTTAPGELAAMAVTRTPDSLSPTTTTTPEKAKYGALPEKAPTKEEWVPNDQALVCMRCQVETFSMFTRRHHCRRCGLVVCATCSSRTAPIGGRSVRVCEHCYEYMFRQRGNTSPSSQSRKSKEKPSASPTLSPTSSPRTTLQMPLSQGNPEAPEWLLGISETENEELRSDFFYDHAPSVSLCTSILQLYTGGIACGRYMLRLCEKLSHIIKPIEQRSTNQEVDYNLIISMMKFLLLNAKLRFVKEHYIDGVGLCESYTNRVEVLSLLISDYYVNLPTVEDLAKIDNVRRLRDKLMEDERPELAMEISTRFGLETTAIWSAWGLTCLRKGDYKAARDKFSKFLKPLKDKSSQTIAFGTILNDILNTLLGQTAVGPCSYTQLSIKNTLKALTSGQDISKSIPLLPTHGSKIDANLENVEECLYYLNTFANHQKVIEFYADNGYLLKAIQYCIDKNCSTDVFIECIFQPAVARGELSFLQEQLLTVDSGLQSCNSYLTAVCRHLARYNKYHVLYQMQVFIKDHLRAAMTCIQAFYLNKAKSYGDLNNRNQHLSKALEHYQSYLGPPRPERASRLKRAQLSGTGQNSELSGRLKLPESEVRRLVSLVKLQIDVAKHMSSSSLAKGPVLSLFGEQQERASLASLVIITEKSVSVGFELAFRIIQDCQLSYNQVYTHAARRFSEMEAYTSLRALLTCIKDSGLCDAALLDRVLLSGIQAAKPDALNSNEIEGLIKLLNADSSKIDAYIMCGKLRNAYLLAIRSDSVETVMKISQEAVRLNQPAVKNICDKYLKQKQVG